MHSKDQSGGSFSKISLVFILSGIVGIILGIILLVIASVFGAKEVLPENSIEYIPIIAVFIATLISGYITAIQMGKALLTGFIQAIVNFVILYALGCAVFMRIKPEGYYLYVFLACVVGAVAGALITAVSNKKHRRRIA